MKNIIKYKIKQIIKITKFVIFFKKKYKFENTNTLTIQLENNKIVIEKTSDKSAVISGETLTYTIVIKNEGNMENTNVMFKDELPSSVTFVEDSVKIDDVESPGSDPNTGFELLTLAPERQIKVSFEVTIN